MKQKERLTLLAYLVVLPLLLLVVALFSVNGLSSVMGKAAARGAVLASVLAAAHGVYAIGWITRAATRAQRSTRALADVFAQGMERLPLMLKLQVLLMGAIVISLALAFLFDALGRHRYGILLPAGLSLLGCVQVCRGFLSSVDEVTALIDAEPDIRYARSVARADAPRLWALVDDCAQKLKTAAPDQIIVSVTYDCAVTEAPVRIMPEDRVLEGRTLFLSLTLLTLIDEGELRADLAHELGHFAAGDTAHSAQIGRVYEQARNNLTNAKIAMREQSDELVHYVLIAPAFWLTLFFLQRLHTAFNQLSRRREVYADQHSVALAGAMAAASSLVRTSWLAPLIDETFYEQMRLPPDQQPVNYVSAIRQSLQRQPPSLPSEVMEQRVPHPFDSHPPTRQRIVATQVPLEQASAAGMRPINSNDLLHRAGLFKHFPALCKQLSDDMREVQKEGYVESRKDLVNAAQSVMERTTIYPYRSVSGLLPGLAALVCLALAGMAVASMVRKGGELWNQAVEMLLIFVPLAVLFGWLSLRWRRLVRHPALTLTANAIQFANLQGPIKIRDIQHFDFKVDGSAISVRFHMEPNFKPVAELAKPPSSFKARFNQGAHCYVVNLPGAQVDNEPLTPEQLYETLVNYLDAGHARQVLREQKRAARKVQSAPDEKA